MVHEPLVKLKVLLKLRILAVKVTFHLKLTSLAVK